MQAYAHLDVGAVRLWDAWVTWSQLEVSPGVFEWDRLDSYVRAAQQHHTRVTLVLAMTPSFYGPDRSLPPTRVSDYEHFVRAVMERYRTFDGRRGIAAVPGLERGQRPLLLEQHAPPPRRADPRRLADPPAGRPRGHDRGAVLRRAAARSAPVALGVPVAAGRRPSGVALLRRQRAQHLPADDVRRADRRARGRHAARRPGPATAGPGRRSAVHPAVGHRGQLRGARGTRDGHADRRAPAGRQRDPHLPARRRPRALGDVLVPLRLEPGHDARGPVGTLGNTLLSTPGTPTQITPAGRAFGTAQHWLRGRLVARDGRRPCARDRRGTYTCVVRYAGGERTISGTPGTRSGCRCRAAPGPCRPHTAPPRGWPRGRQPCAWATCR